MSAEVPASQGPRAARAGWRQWLRWLAAAGVLFVLSEALWVWQTWPVRELLHVPPVRSSGAR
jgi:hypothetical protein